MVYTRPAFLAAMAARRTSIDFFGVNNASIDSCRAAFTVADMDVNFSVVLPTRVALTELASLSATSAATFFVISAVLKFCKTGLRSASVSTAPPVRFFTPRVRDLKRPPTRPVFSSSFSPSSSEDKEDVSSTSSSSDPRNSALFASNAASPSEFLTSFLEKSKASMVPLVTFPSSHVRAAFFLPFCVLAGVGVALGGCFLSPLPVSGSPLSSSSSELLLFACEGFFLVRAVKPFSFMFFNTSVPFLVSAKVFMAVDLLDAFIWADVFNITFWKSASKLICFRFIPLPKSSTMWLTNSLATPLSNCSR
mmetsp:Transcript_49775/g.131982  ORF Transcript_49775/g.131982 Transcript_49775/m.131982 type:complete len:307 (-) Transcript_49775:293-1213(-)